jgi:hypothetical protein
MDSLSVGLMKSETETVKGWAVYLLLLKPTSCLIFTYKERNSSSHPLKHDKSSWSTIFKLLQHLQLISALHPTGNHEFWYCSRSRLLNNSSKTIGNSQDAWKIGKWDKKTHNPCQFRSQKDSRSSPTVQTHEDATLLMLF